MQLSLDRRPIRWATCAGVVLLTMLVAPLAMIIVMETYLHRAIEALTLCFVVFSPLVVMTLVARFQLVAAPGIRYCAACDYDLTGLPENTTHCPECGEPIGPPMTDNEDA